MSGTHKDCGMEAHKHKHTNKDDLHKHGDGTHSHSHSVDIKSAHTKSFQFAILLNVIFIGIEIFYGIKINSTALIADAVHNFTDVIGLLIAWFGFFLGGKKKTKNFTYGFKNATIICSFINAVIVFIAVGYIAFDALSNFFLKREIEGVYIIIVASIGIVINGLTAALFFAGSKDDLNIKGAFIHMLSDALVSLGVVISGVIIMLTGIFIFDSIVSIIIAIVIFATSWSFLIESTKLIFNSVPKSVSIEQIEKIILSSKDVTGFHDLHIWAMSTTENALSAHVIVKPIANKSHLLKNLQEAIFKECKISHITIQIEDECESETKCDAMC